MIYNNFVSDVYADAPQEVQPLMFEKNQTQDVSNKFKLIRHHFSQGSKLLRPWKLTKIYNSLILNYLINTLFLNLNMDEKNNQFSNDMISL